MLLTGQRRDKVVTMKWSDIEDGVWTIATEAHEKGNADMLMLPPAALAVIDEQHRISGNEFVFAGRGGGHFKGFSARKLAFSARVGDIPRWTLHDLRRTARSLLSEAKVNRHISERVLGHSLRGIEGIYDQYDYKAEKAEALQQLANHIEAIVHPPHGDERGSIEGGRPVVAAPLTRDYITELERALVRFASTQLKRWPACRVLGRDNSHPFFCSRMREPIHMLRGWGEFSLHVVDKSEFSG